MNKINAIIVDDEPKARRILESILNDHFEQIVLLDSCADVPSAVKSIHKNKPDLVFLDIEMPGYTGFQLLDFFSETDFEIIFITAYSKFAIQAFQVSAVDYLLKPIELDRMIEAVSRVQAPSENKKENIEVLKENLSSEGEIKKIALPVAYGYIFVQPYDILYLKADGAYTMIYLNSGEKYMVSKKLKEFYAILNHSCFFKPHRSYIINLDRIKQYKKQDGGTIFMSDNHELSLARDQKEEFLKMIKT